LDKLTSPLRSYTTSNISKTMKFSTLSFLSLVGSASAFAPTFGGVSQSTSLEMARRPFISGNWKLNPQTREEALTLASDIASAIGPGSPDADVALFVPYVFIEAAMGAVDGKLSIGAEVSMSSDYISLAYFKAVD
jgi:hypothetical protein